MEEKMRHLLQVADKDGDKNIGLEEFAEIVSDKRYRVWLSAMDIETGDPCALFDLLAAGKKEMTLDDLVRGTVRLKGSARSVDLITIMHHLGSVEEMVDKMCRALTLKNISSSPSFAVQL